MHDGTSGPTQSKADETFEALRREFLEDAGEVVRNLLSFLNEASNGNHPADEALVEARRVAVSLSGGASGFDLPLIGVAAQRFDDYIASMAGVDSRALIDLASYAETLLDLLAEPDGNEETPASLLRRLPPKGEFNTDDITLRDTEVLLVMQPGVATRVIERELQECGYRVNTVHSAYDAVPLIVRTKPNLVIASAVIDELSGIDLAAALTSMVETRNIPIALITSFSSRHESLKFLPDSVPIIKKGASFGDDLTAALQYHFLL